MNTIDRIKMLQTCTASDQLIRDFILKDPLNVVYTTQEELEKELYVSSSSVYRFCKKIDCKSFETLRLIIAQEYLKEEKPKSEVNYNYPFKKEDSIDTVAENIGSIYQDSIAYTLKTLDTNELAKAVYYLRKCNKICFITTNLNTQVAQSFQAHLKEIKKEVRISSSLYSWKVDTVNLNENDVVLINSYAGYSSKAFINVLPDIVKRKIPVILIGSVHNQTFYQYATCKLLICDKEDPVDKIFSYSSNVSTQYVLDLLYSILFQSNYEKNIEVHHKIYK